MSRLPTTREQVEEFCREYIEREFGHLGVNYPNQREVKHHPGETTIPREDIRRAVRDAATKPIKPLTNSVPLNVVPIPTTFMLAGKVFHVEYSETLLPQGDASGDHWFDLSRIRLQSPTPGFPMKQDHIEQTFWHEAIHGVLHSAGKHELAKDEELVMQIAHGVHQILKTARYD